jgi:hypothetical protein
MFASAGTWQPSSRPPPCRKSPSQSSPDERRRGSSESRPSSAHRRQLHGPAARRRSSRPKHLPAGRRTCTGSCGEATRSERRGRNADLCAAEAQAGDEDPVRAAHEEAAEAAVIYKLCNGCGRPFPPSQMKPGRGRCIPCAKAYEREKSRLRRAKKGTTAQRGYGVRHEQLREAWARSVTAGIVSCARCGFPIAPGEPWDLGHDDEDRSRYTGPEHRGCNRSAGAAQASKQVPEQVRFSREW